MWIVNKSINFDEEISFNTKRVLSIVQDVNSVYNSKGKKPRLLALTFEKSRYFISLHPNATCLHE